MLKSTLLAAAGAAAIVALGSAEATAHGWGACGGYGYGPAPAYYTRYHGPAGYGYRNPQPWWASGAVYRGQRGYVIYEPPYPAYTRPRAYFYGGLGSLRWCR
jgi:hypothetical protein